MLVLLAEHTSQANKKPRAGAHPRLLFNWEEAHTEHRSRSGRHFASPVCRLAISGVWPGQAWFRGTCFWYEAC